MLPALIVVTDLDATLLDHFDYSFDAALPALKRLQALQIPLILNSSKTRAELLGLREKLHTNAPFIVENGAGIIIPQGKILHSHSPGMNRAEILRVIHELRERDGYHFTGFDDMSTEQVAEHTGLPLADARLARQREFTEALRWEGSEEQLLQFREALQQHGMRLIRGGRFWHVTGTADKGAAINFLRDYYQQQTHDIPRVIALGDSENDLPMLAVADYPVLVKSTARNFPDFQHPALIKTTDYGPAGWNQAVLQILARLEAGHE